MMSQVSKWKFLSLGVIKKVGLLSLLLMCMGGVGLVAIGVAGWQIWHKSALQPVCIPTDELASPPPSSISAELQPELKVYVTGAVRQPGVVSLPSGSRITDAIDAAGGLITAQADSDYLSTKLNLAAVLSDSAHVHVPVSLAKSEQTTDRNSQPLLTASKISINSATLSELDQLPGIGEKRAQQIIDNRPYSQIEELLQKKVLTETSLLQIANEISL
jgi:competence protein ComEA